MGVSRTKRPQVCPPWVRFAGHLLEVHTHSHLPRLARSRCVRNAQSRQVWRIGTALTHADKALDESNMGVPTCEEEPFERERERVNARSVQEALASWPFQSKERLPKTTNKQQQQQLNKHTHLLTTIQNITHVKSKERLPHLRPGLPWGAAAVLE